MNKHLLSSYKIFCDSLHSIPEGKLLINTINAHSFNVACKDPLFNKTLHESHVLLPDGVSIVLAKRFLTGTKIRKIAGIDLFNYEMQRLDKIHGKCFFLGSSSAILEKIKKKAALDYPNVEVHTYSPPYKPSFSEADNDTILAEINKVKPHVLFIGMTAPKQEKWAYQQLDRLDAGHICSIGAVFDFYAGNIKRAPEWIINLGFEWCFRLFSEPKRLWKRYLVGNSIFIKNIIGEKIKFRGVSIQ